MTAPSIVGLCGSLRANSATRHAMNVALRGASALGARTELIDLREYDLVFCDGKENEDAYPSDVFRLREKVAAAQGILLGTPEYHGSYSGVLKNAIDLMGFDEFSGKMIGLIGVSGGALGGVHALASLRSVGRTLHAWVVPGEASVPKSHEAFDERGEPKDERLRERLEEVGRQVARFSALHNATQTQDFLAAWEQAPPNPGAE